MIKEAGKEKTFNFIIKTRTRPRGNHNVGPTFILAQNLSNSLAKVNTRLVLS